MAKVSTRDSFKLYTRLLQYVRPYWKRMALAVTSAILLAAANTSIAWVVKEVMDDIFVAKNLKMLTVIPFAIIVIYLLKGVFFYGQFYLMGYVAMRVVTDIRDKIYQHLHTLSLAFFTKTPTGVLISGSAMTPICCKLQFQTALPPS